MCYVRVHEGMVQDALDRVLAGARRGNADMLHWRGDMSVYVGNITGLEIRAAG
jgi:hypothetical protein